VTQPFPPPAPGPFPPGSYPPGPMPPAPGPVPPGAGPGPSGGSGPLAKGCLVMGLVFAVVVVAAVVVGGVRLAGYISEQAATDIDNAAVGDCVRETPDDSTSPMRIIPCDQAGASHRVLGEQAYGSDEDCIDVAGATRQVSSDKGRLCLGDKDLDPARSANAAKVGDCLAVRGDDAETLPCSDPRARHRVLSREKKTSLLKSGPSECRNIPGSETSYTISWEGDALTRIAADSVTYCLGPKG
jgi:hypothetical protein